jgi:hypothetical protein
MTGRAVYCARVAIGHAVQTAIALKKSRRRIKAPKVQEHADYSLITSGIWDGRNGVLGSFARQQS